MNLKKGLSLVAFGFFFTFVDINLTVNGTKLNVTPDFVGWILFFLAFDCLGSYTADRKYLKWLSLLLVILSGAVWLFEIARPELDPGYVKTVIAVGSAAYMFILFGPLRRIAGESGSRRADTIGVLRILDLVLNLGFIALALLGSARSAPAIAAAALFLGFAALAAAVVTMVTLFQLRREIGAMPDAQVNGKDVQS